MVRRFLPGIALATILLVAAALRLHALGTELWCDEVVTYLRCTQLDLRAIATTYDTQNQHVFYSLLARLSLDLFGDSSTALRLPAAIFGALSVAALYLLARAIVAEREALLAAALLAVSYHHVWFSQNARGYTAMLFFTLVATWLLLRAVTGQKPGDWIAYAIVTALGVYTHLSMLFVIAGHLMWYLRHMPRWRLLDTGLVRGFGLCALLTLLVYAPILPQVFTISASEGRNTSDVEASPKWLSKELAGGVEIAFGSTALGLIGVLLAGVGMLSLGRARRGVAELLAAPVVVTVVAMLGSGHHLWPRLLFFAIGFGALAVVAGATTVGHAIGRLAAPRFANAIGLAFPLVLVSTSLATVPRAWAPKQRYQEARALIERERRPGDAVAAVGAATTVYLDYYRTGWDAVRTVDELQRIRASAPRTWIVNTFPTRMLSRRAAIAELLESEFTLVSRLDGTLSGGTVLVWRADRETNPVAMPSEASRGEMDGRAGS